MAVCAVFVAGVLTATVDPIATCPGYVLLDSAEYMLNNTLTGLVAFPAASEFSGAWAAGFVLPIVFAVVAWSCGVIMSQLKR